MDEGVDAGMGEGVTPNGVSQIPFGVDGRVGGDFGVADGYSHPQDTPSRMHGAASFRDDASDTFGTSDAAAVPAATSEDALSVSAALGILEGRLKRFSATIVGEISEYSDKPGYKAIYFTLSDKKAALPCLMWRSDFNRVALELRKGLSVEVSGSFSLYLAKGRMNFTVRHIRPVGEGDLRLKVAQLAHKLESEGLMDSARKRALPRLPERIGVVTSPRGKAVQDVLRTLRRRFPLAEVLVAGVPVEGAAAVASLRAGIAAVDAAGCDCILLVRGGGSYEDLMPFNDEGLARDIAACPTPIVTGIGHEPDTTIADMVSDIRASTPTAAAETVTAGAEELHRTLAADAHRLALALAGRVERASLFIQHLAARPVFCNPLSMFEGFCQSVDLTSERLDRALPDILARDEQMLMLFRDRLLRRGPQLLEGHHAALALAAARLDDLSPLSALSRGYAIARSSDGAIVSTIEEAVIGEQLDVLLSDGALVCTIEGKEQGSCVFPSVGKAQVDMR